MKYKGGCPPYIRDTKEYDIKYLNTRINMYDLNFYNVHKESDNIIYTTFVLFIFSQLH